MTSDLFYHPTIVENEMRNRIRVCMFAYAYEFNAVSLVSDADFDKLCLKIRTYLNTNRPDLDDWFRKNFNPWTGQWIHNYPELDKIKALVERYSNKVFRV